jgi:hypothetical protein
MLLPRGAGSVADACVSARGGPGRGYANVCECEYGDVHLDHANWYVHARDHGDRGIEPVRWYWHAVRPRADSRHGWRCASLLYYQSQSLGDVLRQQPWLRLDPHAMLCAS